MGISAQQMLQNDPEYLARQLAQQEIQRYQNFQNPQIGLAATSGALLGRGIGNLFRGRGFFEVSDPALRRVSEVQSIYNQAMQGFDPTNPATSYETLARSLAQAGYGQQAALAAAEANKYKTEATRLGFEKERVGLEKERVDLTRRQILLEEVNKDPYGSIQKALALPKDDPTRAVILAGASARIGEKNFDQAVKEAQIAASRATAAKAAGPEVSESVVTEDGMPLTKKGGKYYKMDGSVYTGKIKKLATPGPYDAILAGANADRAKAGKPALSDEEVRKLLSGGQTTPAAVGGTTWDGM